MINSWQTKIHYFGKRWWLNFNDKIFLKTFAFGEIRASKFTDYGQYTYINR